MDEEAFIWDSLVNETKYYPYASNRAMNIKVGDLVKEKEGSRSYGVIIKLHKRKRKRHVEVLWPTGQKLIYKTTFLEKIYQK